VEQKRKSGENYLIIKASSKDPAPLFDIKGDNFYALTIADQN
jgi:hypothetical protein